MWPRSPASRVRCQGSSAMDSLDRGKAGQCPLPVPSTRSSACGTRSAQARRHRLILGRDRRAVLATTPWRSSSTRSAARPATWCSHVGAGHLMELEFEDGYRRWRGVDPVDLYSASVFKKVRRCRSHRPRCLALPRLALCSLAIHAGVLGIMCTVHVTSLIMSCCRGQYDMERCFA